LVPQEDKDYKELKDRKVLKEVEEPQVLRVP
jgi:hypothetical protein